MAQGLTNWAAVATVMREVAQGLAYMHASGRIHRDLKAANILVGPDGKVALAGGAPRPLAAQGQITQPRFPQNCGRASIK